MAEKDILREYLVKLGFQMDQASAKKFTDFMAGAEKAMVRFMVGIQAAAVAVTAGVSKFASQMERLYWAARHGGSSAGGLRSFEKTAQNLGASVESARSAVIGLASSMRANPVLEAYFKQFGIRTRDANGKLRDTTDLLRDLAPVLREMDFMTAKIYAQQLGISEDLLLAMRDPAFEVMYDNMKKNSAATDKAAEAAARFMQTLRDLEEKIFNVGVVIGEKLINLLGPKMDATAKWFEKNSGSIVKVISMISTAVVNAERIIMPIINKIIEGWKLLIKLGQDAMNLVPTEYFDWVFDKYDTAFDWLGIKDNIHDMLGLKGNSKQGGSRLDPMAFFQSMGWSKEQAAGIVANLQRESNMNPRAVGDNGKAVGIAQWHPDRQANFRKWAGKDLKDASVEEQMRFVHYELTQGAEQKAGNLLKAAKNAEQAGRIVSLNYERPANAEYEASRRGAAAAQIAQTTTIQVIGAGDPVATANRVADAQSRVNQDMVRNFTPVLN
jgi:hypothetical protein